MYSTFLEKTEFCKNVKFEINFIFLIKPFWYMTRKSSQKLQYLENETSFWGEIKTIFHHFQRVSFAKNRLRPESASLTIKIPNNIWCFHCQLGTYITLYSTVNIANFKKINDGVTWEMVVSDNKFVFSCFEEYIVLWTGKICWAIGFHLY